MNNEITNNSTKVYVLLKDGDIIKIFRNESAARKHLQCNVGKLMRAYNLNKEDFKKDGSILRYGNKNITGTIGIVQATLV